MAECHDCRCHFNPPCSACERCVHIDQTVCPEDCQTCEYDHERTGPYRLLDGTWSDGIDRSEPLGTRDMHYNRWEVWKNDWRQWLAAVSYPPLSYLEDVEREFPTHAEAIAYTDRMARTNQGENND